MTTTQEAIQPVKSTDLTGKVALVTGGGTGIGRASAELMAARGAQVLVSGRREDPLAELSESNPDQISYFQADVSQADDRARLVETAIDRYGRLDTLVNNAGFGAGGPFTETTDEDMEYLTKVNLVAPAVLTRIAVPHLSASGGSVVNISSTAGRSAFAGVSVYAATKAGLNHLTRVLAAELGPMGIRVNAVAPGLTRTDMAREFLEQEGLEEMMVSMTPLGRVGDVDDVAKAVAYLASDDAAWVTGQIVDASGGLML